MPSQHEVQEMLNLAQKHNIQFIRLQFTDLMGTIKNVEIPSSQLEKALNGHVMFDGSSIEGFVRIEESDMYLQPDLSTWVEFPWHTHGGRIARMICDIKTADGNPFNGDPRGILQRALRTAQKAGFDTLHVGWEPEFFLLHTNAQDDVTLQTNDKAGYFDWAPLDVGQNCRREITLSLEQMGIAIESTHHEVAPAQHEIDMKYTDALHAADNLQTFRLAVKSIARNHRLHATFMPKPFAQHSGCGLHIHQSLSTNGINQFENADQSSQDGLSLIARHYLAGILHHAPALTAITNPLVNSYKRLIPGDEAPVFIAWSNRNRSPLARVPVSRGSSTRIEIRSPDGAANPYLAVAALLCAGLDGIARKMKLGPPVHENIYAMSEESRIIRGIFRLPVNLGAALEALADDVVVQDAIGDNAYQHFSWAKQLEWEAYEAEVHTWERDRYLRQY